MLKTIYEACNGIEAHMLANLLQQHGIEARVQGEYLQGGIGDLPATGLVRLQVEEADSDAAEKILKDWESSQPPIEHHYHKQSYFVCFLSGMAFGAVIVGLLLSYLH